MFTSCTLPYKRETVVDAMHYIINRAYGEQVFSEPYSKNNKLCMTGREHAYCATLSGNIKDGIGALVIDRTSAQKLMENNNL